MHAKQDDHGRKITRLAAPALARNRTHPFMVRTVAAAANDSERRARQPLLPVSHPPPRGARFARSVEGTGAQRPGAPSDQLSSPLTDDPSTPRKMRRTVHTTQRANQTTNAIAMIVAAMTRKPSTDAPVLITGH
jgi:hypothetical protein